LDLPCTLIGGVFSTHPIKRHIFRVSRPIKLPNTLIVSPIRGRVSLDAAPVSISILNRARQRKQACLDATKQQGENTDSVLLRRELKAQEERNLQLLKKIKVYEDTIQEVLGRRWRRNLH
jgi:hypothetical protein